MSEIKNAFAKVDNRPRTVSEWFALLEDEDQQELVDIIIERAVSVAEMHRILKTLDDPFPFGVTALKDFVRDIREGQNAQD